MELQNRRQKAGRHLDFRTQRTIFVPLHGVNLRFGGCLLLCPPRAQNRRGKVPAGAPHVPAPVWNSAARLGLRYAPVVAQLEELQRKLRSSALPAALRIE